MHIGIFTNTPAHVHLYRECIKIVRASGHDVTVFARDDECALALLEYHDIPYRRYGGRDETAIGLIRELPGHAWNIAKIIRDIELDIVLGMGVYSTYAATLAGADAITVMDSEPTALKQRISAPLVEAILTPSTFRRYLGRKHYAFHGFKETAYLHPEVFTPDMTVRDELGIASDEPYSIVRFNAFNGHHDVGKRGFSFEEKREIVLRLAEFGTVFISDEAERMSLDDLPVRRFDAHPARIHDAIAEAQLLITDTQTMATEAGLIGTPTIRSNSFVGDKDMGNFHALERAGLIYNLTDVVTVLETAESLLDNTKTKRKWAERRTSFLQDKCNLTAVLVEVLLAVADGSPVRSAVDEHPALYRRTAHDARTIPMTPAPHNAR